MLLIKDTGPFLGHLTVYCSKKLLVSDEADMHTDNICYFANNILYFPDFFEINEFGKPICCYCWNSPVFYFFRL